MKKPHLLLFDLGNVLVRFEPDRFSKALGLDVRTSQYHYESSVRELTNKYESGKCSTDEYFNSLHKFLRGKFDQLTLRQAFLSVLTDPIPGMQVLVQKATDKLPSALVSNTNEFHFSSVLPRVSALQCLSRRYLSYQLGVIKPLPEFYECIKKAENVRPDEMLFIDDVEQNVEAANKAGMSGFQFRTADQLEEHLKKIGVL